jgi:hypothetical protein
VFQPTHSVDDLIPEVRQYFDALLERARDMGLEPSIGWAGAGRTCAMQNGLDPAATGASGCQSWHVLGRALDVQLRPWSYDAYRELGEWWESIGGFWGGRWTQFGPQGDTGHFHWPEPGFPPGTPPGCPRGAGEAACEAYRDQYLAEASAWQPAGRSLWSAVAFGLALAGGYWLWSTARR